MEQAFIDSIYQWCAMLSPSTRDAQVLIVVPDMETRNRVQRELELRHSADHAAWINYTKIRFRIDDPKVICGHRVDKVFIHHRCSLNVYQAVIPCEQPYARIRN